MLTPKVKVSFYMSGDDVDLDVLTEQIGIKPTKVRKKSEWPQVSISMGMAKDSWLLETEKEECTKEDVRQCVHIFSNFDR